MWQDLWAYLFSEEEKIVVYCCYLNILGQIMSECPAGTKCVQEYFCDENAVMVSYRVSLTKAQKQKRGSLPVRFIFWSDKSTKIEYWIFFSNASMETMVNWTFVVQLHLLVAEVQIFQSGNNSNNKPITNKQHCLIIKWIWFNPSVFHPSKLGQ